MSYNKTTWATGDIVTAEKLNNIENGIEGADSGNALWVQISYLSDSVTVDKTWNEIFTAVMQGQNVIVSNAPQNRTPENDTNEDCVYFWEITGFGYYTIGFKKLEDGDSIYLSAITPNDYPAWYAD